MPSTFVATEGFVLADAQAILARTPAVLRDLLVGLPEPWLNCTEGGDTWSPRDVVAHLTDLEETDWIPRLRLILDSKEIQEFEPIDRVRFRLQLEDKNLEQLCVLFAERRARNLLELEGRKLQPADLARQGRHPEFGTVTLQHHLATWVVHDFTHLTQIVRTMAKRYSSAVGPWRNYIGVLTR